jgi:hypothetical protein
LNGLDFQVARQRLFRVRGRVLDSATGEPLQKVEVSLNFREFGTSLDYGMTSSGTEPKVSYENGVFEVRDVPPGFYSVSALESPGTQASGQPRRQGYTPVEVSGSDVENVVVIIPPGSSISGRLRFEGRESPLSAFLGNPSITLVPTLNGSRPPLPGNPGPSARVQQDGSFRFDGVVPGEYGFGFPYLDPRLYIKEVRYGVADVLSRPFVFTGRESHSLEIVVSPRVATLQGTVTDNRSQPVPGARVVLVPDSGRHRTPLFRTVAADHTGRFSITAIAPGDYKLFAWESIELHTWFDPEVLRRSEQSATPVRLGESANETVHVRAGPPQEFR